VGKQLADAPDPFQSLPPPIAGSTDVDIETDSNAVKTFKQLRRRESRRHPDNDTSDTDDFEPRLQRSLSA
jgi:hypothetical protein